MYPTHLTTAEKVVEAVLAYYHLAAAFPLTITEALAWCDTLPLETQQMLGILSPYEWFSFPDLKRYQLEKRGISLHSYMARHLLPHQVEYWLLHGDGGVEAGLNV